MAKIADLEKNLRINEDALNEALVAQPEAFYDVAKELAITISRRDEAKQDLEEEFAKVDLAIRSVAAGKEEKTTETQVKSKVLQNKFVIEKRDALSELNGRVGQLTALKEAFQQRGYAIKSLCELHMTNYFGTNPGGGVANQVKNQRAEDYKNARAEKRR